MGRIHSIVKKRLPNKKIRKTATVFLTAAGEYMISCVIQKSIEETMAMDGKYCEPQHVIMAIQKNPGFSSIFHIPPDILQKYDTQHTVSVGSKRKQRLPKEKNKEEKQTAPPDPISASAECSDVSSAAQGDSATTWRMQDDDVESLFASYPL